MYFFILIYFSNAYVETVNEWLRSFAFAWDQRI